MTNQEELFTQADIDFMNEQAQEMQEEEFDINSMLHMDDVFDGSFV
jgi:hypothetical protein